MKRKLKRKTKNLNTEIKDLKKQLRSLKKELSMYKHLSDIYLEFVLPKDPTEIYKPEYED